MRILQPDKLQTYRLSQFMLLEDYSFRIRKSVMHL